MANTENRGWPKPVSTNFVSEDVVRLIQALDMADADVATLFASLADKAALGHGHAIGDITGLATALAGLSPTTHNHALATLSDTSGLAGVPDGYILRKLAGTWQGVSPTALAAAHTHAIADITNLQAALDERLTAASLSGATAKGTPVDADTLPLSDSAASGALKRLSWANIKATLKAYFDTLYAAVGHTHSAATSSLAGFMSAADKQKLDGLSGGKYAKHIFLSSGTWTKPAGLTKVVITCVGGGGGSGAKSTSSSASQGGGGGAGGVSVSEVLAASLAASVAVTVGAGGDAGSTGSDNSTDGGASSFGAHCVANGGLRGRRDTGSGGANGGDCAPGTGSRYALPGVAASSGVGTAPLDGPRDFPEGASNNSPGNPGRPNSGQGASGGRGGGTTGQAGAAGGSGYVIVEEFF